MKGNLARGIEYLPRGARLLKHPALRHFVIVPLLVNVVIFSTLIAVGFSYVSEMMAALL